MFFDFWSIAATCWREIFRRKNREKSPLFSTNFVYMGNMMQKYSEKCCSVNNIEAEKQNTGRATEGKQHHEALPKGRTVRMQWMWVTEWKSIRRRCNQTHRKQEEVHKEENSKVVCLVDTEKLCQEERWGWEGILERSFCFLFFVFSSFFFLLPHLPACGSSWIRSQIRAAAASLHHSRGNTRSKPPLWPTSQLAAAPDP